MPGQRTFGLAAMSPRVAWLWATLLIVPGATVRAQSAGPAFINPPGLTRPTGYTHVVVSADGRTAYIAGQVAFDSAGSVVGVGNFQAQADQVLLLEIEAVVDVPKHR